MTTSRDRSVARRLLAAALGMLVSGCSFVSVQRPRPPAAVEDPRVPDSCTTSSQAPIADTVLAAAGLVAGYVAMVVSLVDHADCVDSSTSPSTCDSGSPAAGLAIFGAGALFTGSAIYGYVSTAKCRHRAVASARCGSGDLGACQRVKPGWTPPPGWRAGATLEPRPPPAPAMSPAPSAPEWTQDPPPPGAPQPVPNPQ